jgi:adenylate cyclase
VIRLVILPISGMDGIGACLMDDAASRDLAAWITDSGLSGMVEPDLLGGFCERVVAAGIPISRAIVIVDTLHPVYEGRVFRWLRDPSELSAMHEYGRSAEDESIAVKWRQSPFHFLAESGETWLRRHLAQGEPADFPTIEELRQEGHTDYLAMMQRFAGDGVIGEMDYVSSSWATDAPGGFADWQLNELRRLVPGLALAIKSASLARIAATLVETYLGRDAGRRVLAGRIARGVADRINTVLWFSDLRGYTRITDTAPPEQIIPLLNDYAEAVITAIHEAGGDVLKLIGDGTLAIFEASDPGQACRCALTAAKLAAERIAGVNANRLAAGLPVTQAYLALHVGEVLYGNIGSADRLDFTVVGPAVNEVARIAAMCRSVERDVLLSSAFEAAAREEDRGRLVVSVGRYALRGVGRAQDLYTLEP